MTDETKKKIVRRSITQTGVPTMFDEIVEQGGNYGLELQVTDLDNLYTVTTEVDPDTQQDIYTYTPKNCIRVNGKARILGGYSYIDPISGQQEFEIIDSTFENITIMADDFSEVVHTDTDPYSEGTIIGASLLTIFAIGNAEIIYDNTIFDVSSRIAYSGVLTDSDDDLNPEE